MRIYLYLPVILLLAVAAAGQQHPNVERGFLPDKSYQLGDVDTVNLFNGTLNASIPLGQRYPVNGSLSYQFVLSYATNGWEVGVHQYTDHVDYYPYLIERFNHYSYPARHMNAGFGWTLSFGRLHREHPSNTWVYHSPDGGQHSFFGTLHANNSLETANPGTNPKITYSRDGTYLRLREYSDNAKLDFPNGEIHQFDATGRLVSITDSFGNSMSIIYGTRTTGVYAGSTQWTIIDTTGRAHYVYFRPAPSYAEIAYSYAEEHERIDYIDLAAFDDPAVSGDGRAVYQLEYSSDGNVAVPDSVLLSRRCPHEEPELDDAVRVGMLKGIQMPENLRYEMTYDLGSQSYCSQMNLDDSGSASGNLTEIKLTTGAKIGFQYRVYDFPTASAWEPSNPGDPAETMYFAIIPGIKSRIVTDSDGTTILSTTEYQPDRYNAGFGENSQRRIVRHKNGQSLVKEVHHYFTVCVVNICGNGLEYGLPLTRLGMPAGGPFLSTETFVPDASGNLVSAGSSWVRYEGDGNLNSNSFLANFVYDLNRRVSYTKTVHDDGTYTEATNSAFDGLGHYRQTLVKSDVTGTVSQRTSLTNFNPARGTFNVDANGAYWGDFSMPPASGKWNLGMFDLQRMTENGQSSTVAACFNANGFLTGRRVYATFGDHPTNNPSTAWNDLLTLFTPDTTTGNVNVEQYLGGDEGVPAPTGAICPASSSSDNYRIEHRYQSGVRKASYFIGPGGSPFSHFILDTDVDANTGLIKVRRETSTVGSGGVSQLDGLKTELKYDALGRMTLETPPSTATNRGARKRVAFSSNSRKVDLYEENLSGSVTFRTRTLELDGLGRIRKETRAIPGSSSATASRTWEFDGIGRLTAASTWGNPGVMTRFEYDPFGRAKKVTGPDGSETTYSYIGIRQSSSTSRVHTGVSQESNATTTTDYDSEGRLLRVTDPAGIKTRYTYDVAGRLTNVCADETAGCTQNRVFTYDNRGFLTAEQTPELGTAGNGTASYQYDAQGNVVRRTVGAANGAFDVKTEYDRAGRLKRIFEAGSGRDLKMFEYGTTNPSGDYQNGRMTRAVRYNWLNIGFNVQVIEDYKYAGRDGRISNRTTYDSECLITPTAPCTGLFDGLEKRSFTQGFTYDELGAVTSSSLPTCTIGDCLAANIPSRTVTNGYDKGWLTSVTWTGAPQSAAIAYHNNGMVASVTHPNQVLDQVLLDPLQIPRPHEIKTTNVIDPATCTSPSFTVQPQSSTIISNSNVDLSAKAEGQAGETITYRWYQGTYPDTTTLVKTEPLAPGVVAWFTATNVTATTSYWVKATNSCSAAGTASQTAVVTVCTVPQISAQPQSHTMTRSQSYTLSVTASGSAPLSYQWYTMSGSTATLIPGATSRELTVTPQSSTNYRVKVTNACGFVNSNTVTVTVYSPPSAPGSISATSNGSTNTVTWSASSSTPGVDYYEVQRRNGSTFVVQMPGTRTFTHGPTGVTPGQTYLYRVRGVDQNGVAGPWSVYDLTVTMTFTDDPLVAGNTLVKGAHVAQLRQAIDSVRSEAGLGLTWGNNNGATGLIYVGHVIEMRNQLNEARLVLGLGSIPVAQPNLNPYGLLFLTYLTELRDGVK
jgi:YD repeat-containing protein